MQQTMNDATKFVDMLHNVSWEDGLSEDVLRGKLDFVFFNFYQYGIVREHATEIQCK
jgi:hypothetical protein